MTILRECPEHREPLVQIGLYLQCPITVHAQWFGDDEAPQETPCGYTEPWPPDLEMQQAGAPRLPGLEGD